MIYNKGSFRGSTRDQKGFKVQGTQRLQYLLIKEYTLNHMRDPTRIKGIFLN